MKICIALIVGLLLFISCKKTYEEGPAFSLLTKKERITGKWKLVSMEGAERIQPEVDQYMELTKEKVENSSSFYGVYENYNLYKAHFTNFQVNYCNMNGSWNDTAEFVSGEGAWQFYGHTDFNYVDFLEKKEGLYLIGVLYERCKILQLKNKQIKIVALYHECFYIPDNAPSLRTLTFEKVD